MGVEAADWLRFAPAIVFAVSITVFLFALRWQVLQLHKKQHAELMVALHDEVDLILQVVGNIEWDDEEETEEPKHRNGEEHE